jgi:hypothetical protein
MTQKEIRHLVSVWKRRIGLGEWNIKVTFKDKEVNTNSIDDVAETEYDPEYKKAKINFIYRQLKKIDNQTVVHEVVHCLLSQYTRYCEEKIKPQRWLRYFEEQAVTDLARAFVKAYRK